MVSVESCCMDIVDRKHSIVVNEKLNITSGNGISGILITITISVAPVTQYSQCSLN